MNQAEKIGLHLQKGQLPIQITPAGKEKEA